MLFSLSPIIVLITFAGNILATSISRNVVSSSSLDSSNSLSARGFNINPQYVEVGPLNSASSTTGLVPADASVDLTNLASTISNLIVNIAQNWDTTVTVQLPFEGYSCALAMVAIADDPSASSASYQAFIDEVNGEYAAGLTTTADTLAGEIAAKLSGSNPYGVCFYFWNSNGWLPPAAVALLYDVSESDLQLQNDYMILYAIADLC